MGEASKIEWCDDTFNPWIGCQKVGKAPRGATLTESGVAQMYRKGRKAAGRTLDGVQHNGLPNTAAPRRNLLIQEAPADD